ncbi:MAG: DUF2891 domain-containing protein [bacterium]|nr:DUF2891 domain-containing protein [bacterium]
MPGTEDVRQPRRDGFGLERAPAVVVVLVLAGVLAPWPAAAGSSGFDQDSAQRFAELALACVDQEYPNKIGHVLNDDADVKPPRELTPAFFGCFDWHSSVHGHWLLVRLARSFPEADLAPRARLAVARSLTPEKIRAEVEYLGGQGRISFERPYGLAWLLQLAAELREWEDPKAQDWQEALEPLERLAAERIREWLPKLTHPIRVGEHSQTAFAFGLIFDWAQAAADRDMEELLRSRIAAFYLEDRGCPLAYEPSGHDFLSPCLAEADLLRRILSPAGYAAWLGAFLPQIPLDPGVSWLDPAVVTDPSDPKLAHLDGLNLSRAWMLDGMAAGLPAADPRVPVLRQAAQRHRQAGLRAVTGEHYEGGHWLGSFATYLVTGRGLVASPETPP